jgi:hypothetical protein
MMKQQQQHTPPVFVQLTERTYIRSERIGKVYCESGGDTDFSCWYVETLTGSTLPIDDECVACLIKDLTGKAIKRAKRAAPRKKRKHARSK